MEYYHSSDAADGDGRYLCADDEAGDTKSAGGTGISGIRDRFVPNRNAGDVRFVHGVPRCGRAEGESPAADIRPHCYLRHDSRFILADLSLHCRRMDGMGAVYFSMGMRDRRHDRKDHCAWQTPQAVAGALSEYGVGSAADLSADVERHAA